MFKFGVGDIFCGINCSHGLYLDYLSDMLKGFSSAGSPDIVIDVEVTDSEKPLGKGNVLGFEEHNFYEMLRIERDGNVLRFSHSHLAGDFDFGSMKGSVKVLDIRHPLRGSYKFRHVFRDYLRDVFAFLLLKEDKILVHSSCVAKDGKAFLFVGDAGCGKSTVTNFCLNRGYALLSDECVLLFRKDGRVVAGGTPFGGDFMPSKMSAGLKSVYILSKSDELKVKKVDVIEGIAHVQDNVFLNIILNLRKFNDVFKDVFSVSSDILSNSEFNILENEKNDEFVKYLD